MRFFLSLPLFLAVIGGLQSQTTPYLENKKWGIKENDQIIIPAVYDTVFNFESSGRVCMACHKVKNSSSSKFIRITTSSFTCNYFNRNKQRLIIRNRSGDTCSVFALSRNSVQQYNAPAEIFSVGAKGKKFLVDKNFKQYTFKGYHSVAVSPDPSFYITELENEAETILTGLINTKEEMVVPNAYTSIRLNPGDSLIVACSAGLGNAEDDIYHYTGKKLTSYARHVEQVTKKFVIHKIFEPKEYYIIYNIATRGEVQLVADEVQLYSGDEIRIRIKTEWFLYDMNTNKKKPVKQS